MQLSPENKKKTLWLVAVLIFSAAGIIYINFFRGTLPTTSEPEETPSNASQSATTTPQVELPYRNTIDLRILESPKFKALKTAPPVMVEKEELGKDNLFKK